MVSLIDVLAATFVLLIALGIVCYFFYVDSKINRELFVSEKNKRLKLEAKIRAHKLTCNKEFNK